MCYSNGLQQGAGVTPQKTQRAGDHPAVGPVMQLSRGNSRAAKYAYQLGTKRATVEFQSMQNKKCNETERCCSFDLPLAMVPKPWLRKSEIDKNVKFSGVCRRIRSL